MRPAPMSPNLSAFSVMAGYKILVERAPVCVTSWRHRPKAWAAYLVNTSTAW